MLPEIQARYSDTILHQALQRAGHDPADCTPLGGFEAHVFKLPGEVLKITHTLRRTEDTLLGEIEFTTFLRHGGVPAPETLPFVSGERVARLPDDQGGAFLAWRQREAPGRLTDVADWDDDTVAAWGALSGRITRLGRSFVASVPERARQHWDAEPMLDFAARLPPDQARTAARAQAVLRRLQARPRTPETYGTVHGDLHHHNFFCDDGGGLHPFDFDDCERGPSAGELAIPLYYAMAALPEGEDAATRAAFAEHFLAHLVRGWRTEDRLTRDQLTALPDFLLLRTALLMSVLYTADFPAHDDAERRQDLLRTFHRRLDQAEPVVEVDWERLARQLAG